MSRANAIRERVAALDPTHVELIDDSQKHAGHAGVQSGGGYFRLTLVSAQFSGKPTVARHRMIYSALGDLMQHDIHALTITALTPDESHSL
ncbi:MAG: BolA family transcriptional regulator [Nitrosomonadales bacterium]|nr:BolA family transcriptional regulator [Nitrosomonadales bacterium]